MNASFSLKDGVSLGLSQRGRTWYGASLVLLLLITGCVKLVSAAGSAAVLGTSDPILPFLSVRQILCFAACLETLVIIVLISSAETSHKYLAVLGLALLFACYKLTRLVFNVGDPCPCLGQITWWLGLKPKYVNVLSDALLAYMLFPSLLILFRSDDEHATS